VGVTVSVVLLVVGAGLTISVDTPRTGANLQTVGLFVMLVAMTAINVVLALRDSAGHQTERDGHHSGGAQREVAGQGHVEDLALHADSLTVDIRSSGPKAEERQRPVTRSARAGSGIRPCAR